MNASKQTALQPNGADNAIWFAMLAFVVTVLLGGVNSLGMHSMGVKLEQENFDRVSKTLVSEVEKEISERVYGLKTFGDWIHLSSVQEPERIAPFAQNMLLKYPDIESIKWLPMVHSAQTTGSHQDAFPYPIKVLENAIWTTDHNQPIYFPIEFVFPDKQVREKGFDLWSHPFYAEVIQTTFKNNKLTLMDGLNHNRQKVYVGYPVKETDQQSVIGIALLEMNLSDFFSSVLSIVEVTHDITFRLTDVTDSNQLIELFYDSMIEKHQSRLLKYGVGTLNYQQIIQANDRIWQVSVTRDLRYSDAFQDRLSTVFQTFFLSVLFAFVASFLIYSVMKLLGKTQYANKRLLTEKTRLTSLIKQISDGYYLTTAYGRILEVNTEACRVSGYQEKQLLDKNISFCFEQLTQHDIRLFAQMAEDEIKMIRAFQTKKNGYQFPTEMKVKSILIGNETYLSFIISDQTVQQAKIRSLDRALQKAVHAEKSKSDFLSNMSHEIRTPLHGVISLAKLGVTRAETAAPKKLVEYFSTIEKSGERLMKLLSEILDLAKLDAGKIPVEFKLNDLHKLAQEVVAGQSARALEKDHKVSILLDHNNFKGAFDYHKIAQVIENLLSNALKFTPKGGNIAIVLAKEEVDLQSQKQLMLRFSIRNEGEGIPPESLKKIFDKFHQAGKNQVGTGGTGLGLAICKEIVALHGGKIWANSVPGAFAQFIFEIPVHQVISDEVDPLI